MSETVSLRAQQEVLAHVLATRYSVGSEPNDQRSLDRLIEVARTALAGAVGRLESLADSAYIRAAVGVVIAELRQDARAGSPEAQQ